MKQTARTKPKKRLVPVWNPGVLEQIRIVAAQDADRKRIEKD